MGRPSRTRTGDGGFLGCRFRTRRNQKEDGAAPARDPALGTMTPLLGAGAAIRPRRRLELVIGKSCRLLKYLDKHLPRQLAGLRVLVRGMVGGE